MAGEYKAGRTSFVADFELVELDFEFFREFLEGFHGGEDTTGALAVVAGISAATGKGVGDGDGFLVDIESDVVCIGHSMFR